MSSKNVMVEKEKTNKEISTLRRSSTLHLENHSKAEQDNLKLQKEVQKFTIELQESESKVTKAKQDLSNLKVHLKGLDESIKKQNNDNEDLKLQNELLASKLDVAEKNKGNIERTLAEKLKDLEERVDNTPTKSEVLYKKTIADMEKKLYDQLLLSNKMDKELE